MTLQNNEQIHTREKNAQLNATTTLARRAGPYLGVVAVVYAVLHLASIFVVSALNPFLRPSFPAPDAAASTIVAVFQAHPDLENRRAGDAAGDRDRVLGVHAGHPTGPGASGRAAETGAVGGDAGLVCRLRMAPVCPSRLAPAGPGASNTGEDNGTQEVVRERRI
jgi:hypothetical protein